MKDCLRTLLFCMIVTVNGACGGEVPTPQSALDALREGVTRASYAYSALDDGYMALCFQRETAPECVKLDAARAEAMVAVNNAVTMFNTLRDAVAKLRGGP